MLHIRDGFHCHPARSSIAYFGDKNRQGQLARGVRAASRFAHGFVLLCLLVLACIGNAAFAEPSTKCSPLQSITVESGQRYEIDLSSCSEFGLTYSNVTAQHGTVSGIINNGDGIAYYTNNGDGANSDYFVLLDEDGKEVAFAVTVLPFAAPLRVTPGSLPAPAIGAAYSQVLSSSGGLAPYHYALDSGTFPSGMSLSSSGSLSGTPQATGSFTFGVKVADSTAGTPLTVIKNYAVQIAVPKLQLKQDMLKPADLGSSYSELLTTSGGSAPYTYVRESGTLPPGLSLSEAGVISGTASAIGTFNFVVKSTDVTSGLGPYSTSSPYSITVTQQPAPSITAVTPEFGPAMGGTEVTVSGSGFVQGTTLKFGSQHATDLVLVDANTIKARSPAGGSGVVGVTATGPGGTSAPHGKSQFTYRAAPSVTAVTPNLGPATGGGGVTITGTGFAGATSVRFGSHNAHSVMIVNATKITAQAPAGSGTVHVTVTSPNGTSATTSSDWYTYVQVPQVTGISPAQGPETGGTRVVIRGNDFSTTTQVQFGASQAMAMTVDSPSQITATTPAGSGEVAVTVRTPGGISVDSASTRFTYGPVPQSAAVVETVAYGSAATQIRLALSGGAATSVAVVRGTSTQGVAVASGTSIYYTPKPGYAGQDVFSYTATNQFGTSAPATVTITVAEPTITFTPSATPNATAGLAYSHTFAAAGGTRPYRFLAGAAGLPAGLSLHPDTGVLSGTPTVVGQFSLTVSATDSSTGDGPYQASLISTVTVEAPIMQLSPANLSAITAGVGYSQTLSARGGTAPYQWAVDSGSLPDGLGLSAGGTLSGTPTQLGSFSFFIRVTDSTMGGPGRYTHVQAYKLNVVAGRPVAEAVSATVAYGSENTPIALKLSGGAPASVAVVSVANNGTATATGTNIVYTPKAGYAGPDRFTYTASNTAGTSAVAEVSVTVEAATLSLTPGSLANPTVGVAYSSSLTGSGGLAPYSYTVSSGALPPGIKLNPSTGLLSGTATQAGSHMFSVRLNDQSTGVGAPFSTMVTYTLNVLAPTLSITPASLPQMRVGNVFNEAITAAGGTAPYGFSVTNGALPAGLTLAANGLLTGTPSAVGPYSFTVQVSDSSTGAATPYTQTAAYSGAVLANAPVAVADQAKTVANTLVSVPVTLNDSGLITSIAMGTPASHGTAKVNGLKLDYTPKNNFFGEDSFTYTASGPGGSSAPATVTITVEALAVPVAQPQQLTVLAGQTLTLDAALGATGGPFTEAKLVAAPATGQAVVQATDILFTPGADAAGEVRLTYTIANAFGTSQPVTSTITVNPLPVAPALSAPALAGAEIEVDLTAGASGGPFTAAAVLGVTPSNAGTASIESVAPSAAHTRQAAATAGVRYVMRFKASSSYSGTAVIGYSLSNAFASASGLVTVSVAARHDVSTDAEVSGLLAAQASTARRFASAQMGNFTRRLESLHGDGWGATDFGLTFSLGNGRAMSDAQMSGYGGEDRVVGAAPRSGLRKVGWKSGGQGPANAGQGVYLSERGSEPQAPDLPGAESGRRGDKQALAFWLGGAVDYGRQNLRGVDTQYRFTTSGISAGGDYRINDLATLGLGLGLSKDSSRIGINGSKSSADSAVAVIYGSLRPAKSVFVDGMLGYGSLSFDSTRYITDGGGKALGTRKGRQAFGSVSAGMEFFGPSWMWSPYGRLEMSQASLNTFTESAPGLQALTYFKQKVRATNGVLGLRGEGLYPVAWGKLMPRVRVEYTHRFQGDDEAHLAYADLADLGPAYVLRTRGAELGNWVVGLGGRLVLRSGVELSLEINSSLDTSNARYRAIALGVRAPF